MENTQNTSKLDSLGAIPTEVELSPNDFRALYSFLYIIQNDFNDFTLVEGVFRSRSNDHTCIVETNFTCFNKMTLYIGKIKSIVKELFPFDKNDKINVSIDEFFVSFGDDHQIISFPTVTPKYIDNKFVTDEEMDDIFFKNIDPSNLFLCETLPLKDVNTIKKMAPILNTNKIFIGHAENDLNKGILLFSTDIDSPSCEKYRLKLKKAFLIPLKKNQYFYISSYPFVFNKDDIDLKYYFSKYENIIIEIHNTKVDDLFVNIYARASLQEEIKKE